ncbi:hypothetical protein N7539_005795 [Penicillium diatomitis]|uniref:Uncharacterized protein n=1 Tax=Penicillium diatomitis TaxID=2819901 RepID=A0A9X0BUB4_9EURO|nr:uncharacterized protein N7539_005795 [Penicillium diatomitis]KAJ5483999.1 hypothetical protein N7539_005795 [Penicillium diatomitis]
MVAAAIRPISLRLFVLVLTPFSRVSLGLLIPQLLPQFSKQDPGVSFLTRQREPTTNEPAEQPNPEDAPTETMIATPTSPCGADACTKPGTLACSSCEKPKPQYCSAACQKQP